MYIDPQQISSIAGMPVHRMGDGQGYEFIYIARCETKICQKSPGIGGLGGLRGANLAPKETAAHIEARAQNRRYVTADTF